jgi:hypothetical protein
VEGEPIVNDDESLEVRYFSMTDSPQLDLKHRLRIEHAIANQPAAFL